MGRLDDKRVAVLVEDDYQTVEAWYPTIRLREEGATVVVVGTGSKSTYKSEHYGYPIDVDKNADEVSAEEFDAVVVPGGFAPDHMRVCEPMLKLLRETFESGKLVATICHAGWMLASAGIADGRRVTGYRPIRDDVVNAGGKWVDDQELVQDGNLLTSRDPDDLPAFGAGIVGYLTGKSDAKSAKEKEYATS